MRIMAAMSASHFLAYGFNLILPTQQYPHDRADTITIAAIKHKLASSYNVSEGVM